MRLAAPRNLPGSIDGSADGRRAGRWHLSAFPRAAKKKTEASLTRLKWLAIVAPLTLLVLLVLALRGLLHHQLHEFPGVVFLLAGLGAGVSIFSFAIFGVVGRLERRISERNQELEALFAVGRAATSSLDLSELLDKALDAVLDVTSAESAEVWLTTASGPPQGERLDRARQRLRRHLRQRVPRVRLRLLQQRRHQAQPLCHGRPRHAPDRPLPDDLQGEERRPLEQPASDAGLQAGQPRAGARLQAARHPAGDRGGRVGEEKLRARSAHAQSAPSSREIGRVPSERRTRKKG